MAARINVNLKEQIDSETGKAWMSVEVPIQVVLHYWDKNDCCKYLRRIIKLRFKTSMSLSTTTIVNTNDNNNNDLSNDIYDKEQDTLPLPPSSIPYPSKIQWLSSTNKDITNKDLFSFCVCVLRTSYNNTADVINLPADTIFVFRITVFFCEYGVGSIGSRMERYSSGGFDDLPCGL